MVIALFINARRRKQFISNYQEKCVFITGTDSGFGRSLAMALDKKGIKVYAGCYTDDGLLSLKEESSNKMKCFKVDIANEESLLAAREYIEKDLAIDNSQLWGLVNNAGIGRGTLMLLCSLDDYKECMRVNFFGTINTTDVFLPLIKKSKGRIINVTSIGRRCPIMDGSYTCSKVAIACYNDGLRRIMKDYGIKVVGIEPGFFPTKLIEMDNIMNDFERNWQQLPKNLKHEYGEVFHETAREFLIHMMNSRMLPSYNTMDIVSDAMTNALFSSNPKISYICGLDAHVLYRFGMHVPDFIMDFIVRFMQSKILQVLQLNLKKIQL